MVLAVIPARGGSKRILRKNIRHFCGKPVIVWSIEAALQSACFDDVVVSTDDEETAEIARAHGATVPFVRPAELSDDHTGTTAVVRHAVVTCSPSSADSDPVCCIYATAPFLRAADIRRGLDTLTATGHDYAFSVTRYPFPIQRALRKNNDGSLAMVQPEFFNTRSQDLEERFHDAAQFYWGTRAAWLTEKILFGPYSAPVELPCYRVVDIDTEDDWKRAESLYRALSDKAV